MRLLAATALMFVVSAPSWTYAEVKFKGILPQDSAELNKKFEDLQRDRSPRLSRLDEAVRFLTRTDSYSSVRLEVDAQGHYILAATPLQKLVDIEVSGHRAFDRDEILAATGLRPGMKFDSIKVGEAEDRLKEFYGRKGYFNAIVGFDFEERDRGELILRIRIREREPCLMSQIDFTGPVQNPELENRLQRILRKYMNQPFTEQNIATLENAIAEYLAKNRYLSTSLHQKEARYNGGKTRVTLTYQINEPYTYEVILTGQYHYSLTQLLQHLNLDDFTKSSVEPSQEIAQKVRDFYLANGFAHVHIKEGMRVNEETFMRRIDLHITEGRRAKIEKIDVVGRISRPSDYYSEFILENSSDVVEDGYYVRTDLENGYKNLTVHLNNEGHLKAKVQSSRVEFSEDRTKARVTVIMDEGPLTQLQQIHFYGVQAFNTQELLDVLDIKTSAPLHLNDLEAGIENLKKFYSNRGHIEMKLLNEGESLVEYDEKGLLATLHFKISEGPQVFARTIFVEGNTFTKDYVILREINIDPGDMITPELLEEARKRLDKLAIFSRVEIYTLEANSAVSQRTLVISVTERNPGLFRFGAGLTNRREITARGFTGVSYNNIAGTARAISLRGTLENSFLTENYFEYEMSAGYLEPFLFDQRLRGRVGFTRSKKIVELEKEKVHVTDSATFSVERDLTSKIKLSWLVWGVDSIEQFDLPDKGPLQRESRQQVGYIGPTIDIDYRDNPFLPTKGIYTRLDAEYADPAFGSSDKIQFVRTQGTVSHYLRLGTPRVIWANSFRTGYEKNLHGDEGSGIPASFGFFLGGFSTLRGYSGSYSDRIPILTRAQENQLIIPGESTYYLIKSEVRFPIADPVGGVVFYDAGQVNIQGLEIIDPFRQSVGIGIRVNTPVGPISIDYARKIPPHDDGSSGELHLTIGTF